MVYKNDVKKMIGKIKNVSLLVLSGFFVVLLILFLVFLFEKSPEYALKVYVFTISINNYLLFFIVPFFLLLSFVKRTRNFGIVALFYLSYAFGLSLWLLGFIVTYAFWGLFGIFVGLCLLGVGVVPVGLLASSLNGEWRIFFNIIIGILITFGLRYLSLYLAQKKDSEAKKEYVDSEINNREITLDTELK